MRNLLLAALLGCFVASGLAQSSDQFRFTDSQGRCWVCSPGSICQPCPAQQPGGVLFDATCPTPDCNVPENRGTLFPVKLQLTHFYQCVLVGSTWTARPMECQCGTFFDYENQRCELPWMWSPYCTTLPIPIPDPIACEITTTSTTTTPPPTTISQEVTTPADTTAAPPCQCIPWIPCWCNPCMNMPCGNCNGCQG